MDDRTVRQHVIDALDFAPMVNATQIGVTVREGVVTLSGHVPSYAGKGIAERVALQVRGVRAIVNAVAVRYPENPGVGDEALAERCVNVLRWDTHIPDEAVRIKVERGCVTLTGSVPFYHHKAEADQALRRLAGVTDIVNLISVRPAARAEDVKAKILAALKRSAKNPDTIRVRVEGDRVILDGTVDVWHEREVAEHAARSAPGVAAVEDHLTISG